MSGIGALLLLAAARPATAQGTVNPGCRSAGAIFQDACQKTVDIFDYLAPQLATAVAGGNATLGDAGTLGGLGHFSLGIRGNAVDGDVPKVDNLRLNTTGAVSDSFPVSRVPVPMLTADLAVGLFKGLPLGITHTLGVDALVSALYIPNYSSNSVSVHPDNPLKLGFGGRVGILGETGLIPAVSVTYLSRQLPRTTVTAVTNGDSLRVQSLDVTTHSWRIVAGKHLLFLGIAGGYGQDKDHASTAVSTEVNGFSSGSTALATPSLDMTRTTYFGDLSLNFPLIKLGAEIGRVSGGSIPTYNSFASLAAGASRLYGSAGVRIKI